MVAVVLPATVVVAPVAGLHGRRLASVVGVASAHGGVASRRGRGAVTATVGGSGGGARSAAAAAAVAAVATTGNETAGVQVSAQRQLTAGRANVDGLGVAGNNPVMMVSNCNED